MSGREHGTRAMYVVEKCRCDDCRKACRVYARWRTRQRAYGRTAYVDADPVRAHLRSLSTRGLGWKRAAALAGLAEATVCKLLYGDPARGQAPSKGVRARTARALLAVTADLDQLADGAKVPAVGTQRRLQALVAIGWSQAKLAERLGVDPGNFGRTLTAGLVLAGTAKQACALYDELWQTLPPETSRVERQAAARARNHAARRSWAPPMAWDDDTIDDPAARPDLGGPPRNVLDLAEVAHLAEAGAHVDEIARRLHRTPKAIEKAQERARARECAS